MGIIPPRILTATERRALKPAQRYADLAHDLIRASGYLGGAGLLTIAAAEILELKTLAGLKDDD